MEKEIPISDGNADEPKVVPHPSAAEAHHTPEVHKAASKSSRLKRPGMNSSRWLMVLIIVLALIGVGYFASKYNSAKNDVNRLSNPQESAKEEVRRTVAAVAALVELPKNETPTVATVSDAAKLKSQGQAFFANAENGDKVIIFTKAKEAILYRPSTNKIIVIAPLNIGKSTKPSSSSSGSTTTQ